jgi:hypothetical protein
MSLCVSQPERCTPGNAAANVSKNQQRCSPGTSHFHGYRPDVDNYSSIQLERCCSPLAHICIMNGFTYGLGSMLCEFQARSSSSRSCCLHARESPRSLSLCCTWQIEASVR